MRRAVLGAGSPGVPLRSIQRSARTASCGRLVARAPRDPACSCGPGPAPLVRPRSPGWRQVCLRSLGPLAAALLRRLGPERAGREGYEGGRAARRSGPEGAPPRPACAGRRSSRAARRAAPRASAALLPRCRLLARSQPDTDSAFSCRRIALEPPRRLRKNEKKKKKGKQQPGGRRSSARPELSPRSAEPPR